MLLKSADEKSHFVTQLQDILAHPSLARERKPFVEREIRALQSQIETQSQSGKAIDEFLEMSEQVVVLHDLRLPLNGRMVTVDHVLINLSLEVVVLNTQHFASGLKMSSKGDFEKIVSSRNTAIRSPLEDSAKALDAVKEACRSLSWPTKLGVQLMPEYRHWVLLHRNANIVRDVPTIFPNILSADEFLLEYVRSNASLKQGLMSLARGVSMKTLEQLASRLLSLHKPLKDDLATRFGVKGRAVAAGVDQRSAAKHRIQPVTGGVSPFRNSPLSSAAGRTARPVTGLSATVDPQPPSSRPAPVSVQVTAAPGAASRPSRIGAPSELPSLRRKPSGGGSGLPVLNPAARGLERAVAAGALSPRTRADTRVRTVTPETRAAAPLLRVPDQPDSFRKDTSLRAELLRPRTESDGARPEPVEAPVQAPDTAGTNATVSSVIPAKTQSESAQAIVPEAATAAAMPVVTPAAPAVVTQAGARSQTSQGYYCKDCTTEVTIQTAKFCWQNKHRFSGRVYCSSCQEKHPAPSFPRREPRPARAGS